MVFPCTLFSTYMPLQFYAFGLEKRGLQPKQEIKHPVRVTRTYALHWPICDFPCGKVITEKGVGDPLTEQ